MGQGVSADCDSEQLSTAFATLTARWFDEATACRSSSDNCTLNIARKDYVLSTTIPGLAEGTFAKWLGHRLVLSSANHTIRQHTAIVSSRIGTRLDKQPNWFHALRTAVLRCDPANEALCWAAGTTTGEALHRCSELFGVPQIQFDVSTMSVNSVASLRSWLLNCCKNLAFDERVIHISPELITDKHGERSVPGRAAVDAALILTAGRIVVLHVRRNGNLEELLTRHLEDKCRTAPVLVAQVEDARAESSASSNLTNVGAVPWLLYQAEQQSVQVRSDAESAGSRKHPQARSSVSYLSDVESKGPLSCPEDWLCHWTRPHPGPWRDQTRNDYLDELILGCESVDRSAFATLLRILRCKIIQASVVIQGATPTVSWTSVPLAEFRTRRVYRKHKRQYDFEPWGIAVSKSWLWQQGCRPVKYVRQIQAPEEQHTGRELLQPEFNRKQTIDWSLEKEWRVCGDVNLADAPADNVVAFLNTEAECLQLRQLVPWRAIALPR